jgi:translation initiation factor IF-1
MRHEPRKVAEDIGVLTNIAWKHEEVIVCQPAVLGRVDQSLDVDYITLRVLILEHLKRCGEIQGVLGNARHGVAVDDGHSRNPKEVLLKELRRIMKVRLKEIDRSSVELWPGKSELFPRAKVKDEPKAFCVGKERSVRTIT